MMITINLLPEELKKKEPRFKKVDIPKVKLPTLNLKNLPILKIAIGVAIAIVALQVLVIITNIYSASQLKELTKRYNDIIPKKKEADQLKAQAKSINDKIKTIDELMVKRFSWARKLNDLSDSMTPGIWLSDLTYDEKMTEKVVRLSKGKQATEKAISRYMTLSGYASSMGEQGTALIGKFIKSLKDNDNFFSDFSSIELGSIRSDRIENQEVMNFKITCLFKE